MAWSCRVRPQLRRRGLVGVVIACLLAAPSVASARASTAPQQFDAPLTFDPHYGEGEPSIAVNPRNPANIIVTFLADTYLGVSGLYHGQPPTARDCSK